MFAKSSYLKSTNTTIFTGKGVLTALLIITDGSNDAAVTVYDASDSGGASDSTTLWSSIVKGASGYGGRNWTYPVEFKTGLYVTVTGTGAKYIVEYIA